jgi:hypothetical protein
MAFTRFRDDPCRINIQNQQSTDQGRWILNTPGNGDKPYFMEDANIISQKWGGNLWSNATDVQSYLMGLHNPAGKDCLGKEKPFNTIYEKTPSPNVYPSTNDLFTEQSRAIAPSWTVRDIQQVKPNYLHFNPQENTNMNFPNNLNTRILEKDAFDAKFYQ